MRNFLSKPIFISLSPNVEKDDIFLALGVIVKPWKKTKLKYSQLFEKKFKEYLGVKYAFSFNSGRSAWLGVLKALNLKEGDEVLIQAFTCNALVNPILALGLRPVYVDIEEETLNMDPRDLERKISEKSRVVVVQHTFGLPADLDKISEICQKYNLILIEDCAHSLGAEYKGRKIGTFGRASFFSFGRDKIISSVYGGMAVTNDPLLAESIRQYHNPLNYPGYFWIFQQLLHPVLTEYFVKPLYRFNNLGKYFLIFLQKIGILSKGVTTKEKKGKLPRYIPKKMPDVLAILALNQFKKLEKFNRHRKEIAYIYQKEFKNIDLIFQQDQGGRIFMRFPLIFEGKDTDKILKKLRKFKIFLDDGWRKTPIVPPDTNQKRMNYIFGMCPIAEKVIKNILNLPTHINIKKQDAEKIISRLKYFTILRENDKK
ncbi:MAG: aminotransferase class I/II-fold pyridoxal phosphate-dependent enzyme [Candidatus Pacebacteria bacterium]|nr:aminotransferase class I/II-fold pyridoxal phosphate-dependent enzyme [Candidatus Paceibacterota bacterium]